MKIIAIAVLAISLVNPAAVNTDEVAPATTIQIATVEGASGSLG